MSTIHILQILHEIGESFDFSNKRYGLILWGEIKLNIIIVSVFFSNTFYSKLFI